MRGRLIALALLIALNLIWAAWAHFNGVRVQRQAEPERLQRQVRPESIMLRPLQESKDAATIDDAPASTAAPSAPAPEHPASEAAPPAALPDAATPPAVAAASPAEPAASAPASNGACLMAGIFDDKQIDAVRRAAASLPANSWHIDQVALPSRWMVYIGKLADADAVRAKRAELQNMGISTDRPAPALEPGLSLGRFSSEEQARRALADLTRKGVRTAQVVQERRDTPGYVLRLPGTDAALRQQATRVLRSALGSKELHACE